jgi:hypothetical protein
LTSGFLSSEQPKGTQCFAVRRGANAGHITRWTRRMSGIRIAMHSHKRAGCGLGGALAPAWPFSWTTGLFERNPRSFA